MISVKTHKTSIPDAFVTLFRGLSKAQQSEIINELWDEINHPTVADETNFQSELPIFEFNKSRPVRKKMKRSSLINSLINEIESEYMMASSPSQIEQHPDYEEIIEMGKKAIPYLIQRLDKTPTKWFRALEEISHTNPVPIRNRGNISEMVKAWKNWAKKNRYVKRQLH